MFRFALVVASIELGLTALAAVWVGYAESADGTLDERDLRSLGLEFDEHRATRRTNAGSVTLDTTARLLNPAGTLYVSVRTDARAADYELRRLREETLGEKPERGSSSVIEEPLPGEKGYAARYRGPKSIRFELARLRGDELLILRVSRERVEGDHESPELVKCERRARIVQELMVRKLGWRR